MMHLQTLPELPLGATTVPISTPPTLSEISLKISGATTIIDRYIKNHNLSTPSLDENGPESLPRAPEVVAAKMQLLELLSDLTLLVQGPAEAMSQSYQVRCD
jgi:hypothetical protein